jgi:hypothetical protein
MKTCHPKVIAVTDAAMPGDSEREPWLAETLRHVKETEFGQVTLTIHQGEVIEVQKTEKRRFNRTRKDDT